jgi:hypothetical protein
MAICSSTGSRLVGILSILVLAGPAGGGAVPIVFLRDTNMSLKDMIAPGRAAGQAGRLLEFQAGGVADLCGMRSKRGLTSPGAHSTISI